MIGRDPQLTLERRFVTSDASKPSSSQQPDDQPTSTEQSSVADSTVDQMPSAASAKLDKKKTVIGAIITLIILGFVFWGLSKQFGSFSDAWTQIQAMPRYVTVSLILVAVVNIVVYVFPYQRAIPGLKYKPAFMVRQTSWMMAALVPAGGAFALALQYVMLASYRVAPAAATTGIAVTSVWSFFMTFLLPVLGVLAIANSGELQSAWVYAGLIGLAALIIIVVLFWLILRSETSAMKVGKLGQKVAAPVFRRMHKDIDLTDSVMSFRDEVVDVVKDRWMSLTVTNLAVSFMQFMILFVAVRGVAPGSGDQISFAEIFAAFAISRLGTLIPITPGGLGTVAGVLGAMLAAFGLSEDAILAAVVVWQVVQLLPQAATGIATLVGWRVQEGRAQKQGKTTLV